MVSGSGRCIDRIEVCTISSKRINPYAMHADDKSITSAIGWMMKGSVWSSHGAHMKMKIYDCYFSHISRPLIDL